jgi:hypothetical protein
MKMNLTFILVCKDAKGEDRCDTVYRTIEIDPNHHFIDCIESFLNEVKGMYVPLGWRGQDIATRNEQIGPKP